MERKIPLLNLQSHYHSLSAELTEVVLQVFATQRFILGPEVKKFEEEFTGYCKSKFAIGCASGSDALLLALMSLGIDQDDEVITTPYTFFATVSSITRLGAKPVFVDIEEGTFNIDASQLEKVITNKTKAIIPVHLFGQCAEMSKIQEVVSRREIFIVEDAAQAVGAIYQGEHAGSIGTIGTFSFYPSKNLGGAGDGGMLTTQDPELAEKLFALRAHGAKKKYYHDYIGINSRLDELQAAILRVKLKYLDDWTNRRRENAATYKMLFSQTDLLDRNVITLPVEMDNTYHVYNQFVIRSLDRDRLRDSLSNSGIGTEIYYPLPLHLQPCFQKLGYKDGDLPVSEKASKESLAIPIYPELSFEDQEYIVQSISCFYDSYDR